VNSAHVNPQQNHIISLKISLTQSLADYWIQLYDMLNLEPSGVVLELLFNGKLQLSITDRVDIITDAQLASLS
jgi:hypothetical protein